MIFCWHRFFLVSCCAESLNEHIQEALCKGQLHTMPHFWRLAGRESSLKALKSAKLQDSEQDSWYSVIHFGLPEPSNKLTVGAMWEVISVANERCRTACPCCACLTEQTRGSWNDIAQETHNWWETQIAEVPDERHRSLKCQFSYKMQGDAEDFDKLEHCRFFSAFARRFNVVGKGLYPHATPWNLCDGWSDMYQDPANQLGWSKHTLAKEVSIMYYFLYV